jgi:2Fe-2S ferredoxin
MEISENSKKIILIEPEAKKSCLDILLDKDIQISHSCGGNGTCGTCRIFIESSTLNSASQPSTVEAEFAYERGLKPNERLACQLYLLGPLKFSFEE